VKTGVHEICKYLKTLDSGLRRNDGNRIEGTFCEIISFGYWKFGFENCLACLREAASAKAGICDLRFGI